MIDQGEILKRCREFRGMTRDELSELAGVSTNTIYRIEKNVNGANLATYEVLLYALGFELEVVAIRNGKWRRTK